MIGAISLSFSSDIRDARKGLTAKSAMTDAGALQAVKAELAALKASLDVAVRNDNSQLAKIADRMARVERTSNEPATKLARIAEAIDRLEKKAQATGAISAKKAGARHSSTAR